MFKTESISQTLGVAEAPPSTNKTRCLPGGKRGLTQQAWQQRRDAGDVYRGSDSRGNHIRNCLLSLFTRHCAQHKRPKSVAGRGSKHILSRDPRGLLMGGQGMLPCQTSVTAKLVLFVRDLPDDSEPLL